MNGLSDLPKLVGCKNASVGERSSREEAFARAGVDKARSETAGLSNANIGENPLPRKPKGSPARFVHDGVSRA
ncbi:hypothetical protein Scep_020801 [Stephania cephalantha]|uniref:Uncharacterized protein n=1 Tax=Stephania cephalantha TaxID=152367 RepID=A0AAP0IEJ4_9MAGN